MENIASNNTLLTIKHWPVFAGSNKEAFRLYKTKLRICLSFYSKPIVEVLQDKTQPPHSLLPMPTRLLMPLLG